MEKLKAADLLIKNAKVKDLVPDLQVSPEFIAELNNRIELMVVRSADRCRQNKRKRMIRADV